MILTESRSLAGVLRHIVSEYRARIASTNGQCGGFLRTDIAPQLRPGDGVLYLGDYDLSGDQIEDNTRRVLEREIGGAALGAAGADRGAGRATTTCRTSSSATAATRTAARTRRSRPRRSASAC